MTRDESRKRQSEPPKYLQRLAALRPTSNRCQGDGAIVAYAALLDRILEDRRVDDTEAEALVQAASSWGLSAEQITRTHTDYVYQLARAALADGEITRIEHDDLSLVGRLLGQDAGTLDAVLKDAIERIKTLSVTKQGRIGSSETFAGKKVCFTGESPCHFQGERLTRSLAEELALNAGMQVMNSVTKKLDILVVADPHTQSGKAKKARDYGVRVLHEPVFWSALGIAVE
jgi:DNA polymerase-3 subunit epsilon